MCRTRLSRAAFMLTVAGSVLLAGIGEQRGAVEAQRLPRISVTIVADSNIRHFTTSKTTVSGVLEEANVELGPLDVVAPALRDRVGDGSRIKVTRVMEQLVSETQPIGFETEKAFSTSLRPGVVVQTKQGVNGEKIVHYKVRYEDGVAKSRTKVSSIVVKRPVNGLMTIGSRGRYTSRGSLRTVKVMKMSASAYDPGPRSCGKYATGRTSCGLQAGYGVVAVDPRVIALGSKLYVEGYGHAIAGDVGRAIKGYRIDLGFNTHREAIQFGRRQVTVHLLEE